MFSNGLLEDYTITNVIFSVNLTEEIYNAATQELSSTMYKQHNNICFYGICYYCNPNDAICGINNILEGALILWLPSECKLSKYKHPWQRTYTKNRLALWEKDMKYCHKIKESKMYAPQSSNRLLYLIDTAIFDYLMDNGDRHHYEILKDNFDDPAVLLIDNGKSLGNSDVDHIDILAPLYQCCMLRKTTWERLQILKGGSLSYSLKKLLAHESLMADVLPITTEEHLEAIDRRLLTIFAVTEFCLKSTPRYSDVIVDK